MHISRYQLQLLVILGLNRYVGLILKLVTCFKLSVKHSVINELRIQFLLTKIGNIIRSDIQVLAEDFVSLLLRNSHQCARIKSTLVHGRGFLDFGKVHYFMQVTSSV